MSRRLAIALLVLAGGMLFLGGIIWLFADLSWPLGGTLAALAIVPAIAGGRRLRR